MIVSHIIALHIPYVGDMSDVAVAGTVIMFSVLALYKTYMRLVLVIGEQWDKSREQDKEQRELDRQHERELREKELEHQKSLRQIEIDQMIRSFTMVNDSLEKLIQLTHNTGLSAIRSVEEHEAKAEARFKEFQQNIKNLSDSIKEVETKMDSGAISNEAILKTLGEMNKTLSELLIQMMGVNDMQKTVNEISNKTEMMEQRLTKIEEQLSVNETEKEEIS